MLRGFAVFRFEKFIIICSFEILQVDRVLHTSEFF